MNRKKLGRGLQALLGVGEDAGAQISLHEPEMDADQDFASIPVELIVPSPYQPRRTFEAGSLEELAASIRVHGVIQPIVVRRVGETFQLIAGERRLRAAQQAGLTQIPARVLELDEQKTYEVALIENLQRSDLNAVEKARAFEGYITQFATTHEQLAQQLGVDRTTVTNLLRLLELPETVQEAVQIGQITFGHARALLSLDDAASQIELCRRIVTEALSVRQTEALIRERKQGTTAATPATPAKANSKSNHILSLESDLKQKLGTKVEIRPTAKDKGTIIIHFESNDDFERVLGRISS